MRRFYPTLMLCLPAVLLLASTTPRAEDEAVPDAEVVPAALSESLAHELRAFSPQLGACWSEGEPLSAGFATCVCDAICAHTFVAEGLAQGSGAVTLRLPFIDVDGLVFDVEPSGVVTTCRYEVGADVLADVACEAP
jgi:hypothetical protein